MVLAGAAAGQRAGQGAGERATAHHLAELARLRRVRDRIDRDYAEPLDLVALARDAHLSVGHLSRRFRAAYGEAPHRYLMTRRVERAMALLRRGELSVTEVCLAVGCQSLGSFTTRFTELVGMSPGAYRAQASTGAPAEPAAGALAAPQGLPPCVARQVARPRRHPAGSVMNGEAGARSGA